MTGLAPLKVMISSRCNDRFPQGRGGRPLSEIRRALKRTLEAEQVFGRRLFDVWINEEVPPQGGAWDSWEVCLAAAKSCDVFLALVNGNAGWAQEGGEVGICHAELMSALATAPAKVRLIDLGSVPLTEDAAGERNRRFQAYVAQLNLFRGDTVETVEDLHERVGEALHDALLGLAKAGVRESARGRFDRGEALEWSRLDFGRRRQAMARVLRDAVREREGAEVRAGHVFAPLAATPVLVVPDAIPAALSVAAARELVGQPFLRDHERAAALDPDDGGPVHVIACHRNATEAQATRMLGFPDATVVSAPFGVFVADNVQKVQFAFLVHCRDETTTRHAVQRFFEWLAQTGEERRLAYRARARARIVRAIAAEQDG